MTTREASFDTGRLRALAEKATPDGDLGTYTFGGTRRLREFQYEVDPPTVLALLDEIESLRDQVDSLRLENEMLHVTNRTNNQYLLDEIERLRGEGEWEYAWAGEDWLLEDEVFPSPQVAENWVGLLSTRRWVREEGGYLVRRRAAGPWERVEGDGDMISADSVAEWADEREDTDEHAAELNRRLRINAERWREAMNYATKEDHR